MTNMCNYHYGAQDDNKFTKTLLMANHEYSIRYFCEIMQERNHTLRIYNN